jgi:hypothetical protein
MSDENRIGGSGKLGLAVALTGAVAVVVALSLLASSCNGMPKLPSSGLTCDEEAQVIRIAGHRAHQVCADTELLVFALSLAPHCQDAGLLTQPCPDPAVDAGAP